MKRKLEYESEKVLPEEIDGFIKRLEQRICEHPYETDKIRCDFGDLKYNLVRWFAEKEAKND